ncbi:site-specific DNA-methyltransferase [Candidatus Macondimonas diazotrophica]|jgi:site-specific DNA-methyltransferase (adenine-specific)|uniref:Methyltransferase n=1 Tax=Candidatus Macondimonas diazotrophica TaxID=2305248 RepID=A0A4Z0F833_9GAMM|nr:site-specific DNA-methyltransferase [Candidatus Macondimonas diazotrophica]TFZ81634.1 site-specific DNA-methyltransferase [Candidatus Macondimonas diazotrophica]
MAEVTIYPGDCRESLKKLIEEGVRVHSVVADPPYGLVSIQKRFGKKTASAAKTDNNDGSFSRLSGGFMGKAWDATEIERDPEFWKLILDILLPGGFVFAFSGSRTGHWQACAMEQAGFIMHPMHGWVYGSGFPKGHRPKIDGWDGWAYGTQTQKPALEPIYLAQKPFSEKTGAANLLKHGVGAFNIDDCRVPSEEGSQRVDEPSQETRYTGRGSTNFAAKPGPRGGSPEGRYPSNLLLDDSECVKALFPESPGQLAKATTTEKKAKNTYGDFKSDTGQEPRGDGGSASRFFHRFPDAAPIIYNKKANKSDRSGSKHPTVKPIALMQYLVRHITPPGGVVLDPFGGSGTTAEAAMREGFDCLLMEAEPEYVEFLTQRFGIQKQAGKESEIQ